MRTLRDRVGVNNYRKAVAGKEEIDFDTAELTDLRATKAGKKLLADIAKEYSDRKLRIVPGTERKDGIVFRKSPK